MTPTCPDCGTETRWTHQSSTMAAMRCRPCLLRMLGLPATFDPEADLRQLPADHPRAAAQQRMFAVCRAAGEDGSGSGDGVPQGRQRRTHQGGAFPVPLF